MEKWKVQAVKREGFNGVWRAGRHWPSNEPIEVEVLDDADEADPKIEVLDQKAPGGKRMALNPGRLSRKSFEAVFNDPRLSKVPAGGARPAFDGARVADLEAQLASAQAKIVQLEQALAAKVSDASAAAARGIEPGHLEAFASPEAGAVADAPPPSPPAPKPEPEAHQDEHHPGKPRRK